MVNGRVEFTQNAKQFPTQRERERDRQTDRHRAANMAKTDKGDKRREQSALGEEINKITLTIKKKASCTFLIKFSY